MTDALTRIAEALERLAPAPMPAPDFTAAEAFAWHTAPDRLEPVVRVSRVDIGLLIGINRSRDTLLENTRHFAAGLPANNALLWGARGMGKSSLVKAVHAQVRAEGFDLRGPASADTMFHARAREGYDVAICMYHDQALIPIKTLDFDGGVNVTLGLPFIRTSPDHGTAYDIAYVLRTANSWANWSIVGLLFKFIIKPPLPIHR